MKVVAVVGVGLFALGLGTGIWQYTGAGALLFALATLIGWQTSEGKRE